MLEVQIRSLVQAALAEDIGSGDITTACITRDNPLITARMVARQPVVLAGMPVVAEVLAQIDPAITLQAEGDGSVINAGQTLATLTGPAKGILTAERVALNFLQILSGIATTTRSYADKIATHKAVLLDTRKTIPGLRALSKYATRIGGAHNHRQGLFDAIMIKDNHIALAGSVQGAVGNALAAGHTRIICECDTLAQVEAAIAAGATYILLDNMTIPVLQQAVAAFGWKVPLEASGGITLETIAAVAETGVDYISTSQITFGAKAVDIGLDWG